MSMRLSEADPRSLSLRPGFFLALLLCGTAIALFLPFSVCLPNPSVESPIGSGELLCKRDGADVPLPMLDMDVELSVTGVLVHGEVTQKFTNPYPEVIEALYVFPLPENAAVHEMEMRIGGRRILSVIQEREEARQTYETAKQAGKKAAIVEEERPNLFTSSVANVNPGESVEVRLSYLGKASYAEGTFRLAFPLTFTPRYVPDIVGLAVDPAGTLHPVSTTVRDAERITPPFVESSNTAAPRARLAVSIHAGVELARIDSPSHEIEVSRDGDTWRIRPRDGEILADRDFHLEWSPAPDQSPRAAVFMDQRGGEGYALLMMLPPTPGWRRDGGDGLTPSPAGGRSHPSGAPVTDAGSTGARYAAGPPNDASGPPNDGTGPPIEDADRATEGSGRTNEDAGLPAETLFIIDVSGSMDGPSIWQARKALELALGRLQPSDSFNLLKFNQQTALFSDGFLPASGGSLDRARRWVRGLNATGGTEIYGALVQGLNVLGQPRSDRVRRIILLTDGAVGNESQVLDLIEQRIGDARLHVLGIGHAPNRYLMRELASFGRGVCEFISTPNGMENRIDAFLRRVARPTLTDLALSWEGVQVDEVYPSRLPDLHGEEPLLISAKVRALSRGAAVILTGRGPTGDMARSLSLLPNAPQESGVATRWARAKVADLMDGLHRGADAEQVRNEVIAVGKEYQLVTRYTSLVAVETTPTAAGVAEAKRVANALPHGSTLLGGGSLAEGDLPSGGTSGPLKLLIGLFLTAVGLLGASLSARRS